VVTELSHEVAVLEGLRVGKEEEVLGVGAFPFAFFVGFDDLVEYLGEDFCERCVGEGGGFGGLAVFSSSSFFLLLLGPFVYPVL
jgi:hypothetical protein